MSLRSMFDVENGISIVLEVWIHVDCEKIIRVGLV